jgi:protocatechuate 3,4-dioxygenase beta subunit
MLSIARPTHALALLGVLAGCRGESTGLIVGPPARLEVVSGEAQSAPAGTQLATPLVVRVTDANGNPVPQQIVNFVVTSGGGGVFAPAAITNADGTAQNLWTLGTSVAAPQTLEARAVDPTSGAPLVFATFHATVAAGAATQVTRTAGNAQSGLMAAPLTDSLQVKVLDQYGNPVPNVTVTWAAADGGTVSPATSTTRADGTTRAAWTLGNHASAGATATVASLTPATFTATGGLTSTMGVTVTKISGDGQTGAAGSALVQPLVVSVKLADGRPVVGVDPAFRRADQGYLGVTGENGQTQLAWTLGTTTGQETINATANWIASPVTFTATVVAAAPASVLIQNNGSFGMLASSQVRWLAGTAFLTSYAINGYTVSPADSISAIVKDRFGNGVAGATVTWSASDAVVRPTATTAGSDGTARTHFVAGLQPSWVYARIGALADSSRVLPQDGSVATLVITPSPLTLAAGSTADLLIKVRDPYGSPLDVDSDYLTWTSSDPTIATVSTGASGRPAHATVTAHAAGTVTLTGAIGSMTGTVTVTVTP